MNAVKGFSKQEYVRECKEEGGEVFGFISLDEAAEYLCKMTQTITIGEAKAGIENDTNCDWVLFKDGSVIFRYFGKGYNEKYTDELRNTGRRL